MERNSCCAPRLTQSDLTHQKRSFQRRTSFLFLSPLLLRSILRFVVNLLSGVVLVVHSVPTAFLMQNASIADLLERIFSGRLLIPNVEDLSGSGEARILPEMSELELSNLMINSNRIAAVLVHLQGVVEDLHQTQFNEWTRCQEPTLLTILKILFFSPTPPLSLIQVSFLTITHHRNKTKNSYGDTSTW